MALERPTFSTTKLREGYDVAEVDDAIDRVFAALAEPVPTLAPADLTQLRFTPVRMQQGYDMGEVDDWLDLAVAELGRHASGAIDPVTAVPTPPGEPATALAAAQAAYDSNRPETIVEVPGRGPWFAVLVLALLVVAIAVVYVVS